MMSGNGCSGRSRAWFAASVAALAALAGSACAGPIDAEDVGAASAAATCAGCVDVYVVAHEDDDLLFMNPDLLHGIRAGNDVATIYLTSGDAGDQGGAGAADDDAYWLAREEGIRRAYARMAGVPSSWSVETPVVGGRTVRVEHLAGTSVSVVFLRMPDGNPSGTGYAVNGNESIEKLWDGRIALVHTLDGASSYTRDGLIGTLRALFVRFGAERIGTLDSTNLHTNDHSDHVASARFAFAAQLAYGRAHDLSLYRTYNISDEHPNVPAGDRAAVWDAIVTYSQLDSHVCPPNASCNYGSFGDWSHRQYSTSRVRDVSGPIGGLASKCVDVRGAATADGTPIQLWSCVDVPQQRWNVQPGGSVTGLGGKCLTVAGSTAANGTPVELRTCDGRLAQRWTLTGNGQLRGVEGKCLDVRGGATDDGTPLQIWDCEPVPQQRWAMQRETVRGWSEGAQFSDADLGAHESYWGSVRLGDVDGDGRADACARRADGLYCAKNLGGRFGAYARFTTEFSDALGWRVEKHGTTLDLGDIDGDGRDDVCGRGAGAILCATSAGSSFVNPRPWVSAFTDASGFGDARSRYGSVHLGDVTGDGLADVCGRTGDGVWCAVNRGTGAFAPATRFLSTEFTDAAGWGAVEYGSTVRLGDVNGDGRADVCGRGVKGIHCALSTGSAFTAQSLWASDFSDASGWAGAPSYYRSIRLADIDGDGRADVCGRGKAGVFCAISNGGTSFDVAQPLMPRDYTDARGWRTDLYGTTMQLADLDDDGRADVCGRGSAALLCASDGS